MPTLHELRYPTRWWTKLLMALLALAFFAVLATTAIAGLLVSRIVKPQRTTTEINMASFPGRPQPFAFQLPRVGWTRGAGVFPRLPRAAALTLCDGELTKSGA